MGTLPYQIMIIMIPKKVLFYLKGVGADYNWDYFKEFLVEGQLPDYTQKRNEAVLISQYLANRLHFKLGDDLQMVFGKQDLERPPNIITYHIVGIFNSGFQELDAQYLIGDIRHLQRINGWKKDQVGHFEVLIKPLQIGIIPYSNGLRFLIKTLMVLLVLWCS